jgi:predicted polyphosphate/ATP-dependent NAD kinase
MNRRIGLIVNPIAGLGGRVGLKGTDQREIVERARALGATPLSPARACETLRRIADRVDRSQFELLTAPGEMGHDEARRSGLAPMLIGLPHATVGETSAADTFQAARQMLETGVDLLVFAGGDGTARDVFDSIGDAVPVVGIPTGVKIHSAVFARHPRAAAELVVRFLDGPPMPCREAEVMDIDEDAARAGRVSARLYGYLRVPREPSLVQGLKAASSRGDASLAGIASDVVERMQPDRLYILGPGTTTRAITTRLGLPKTLLGVDVVRDGRVVASDANERDLLRLLAGGSPATVVVTPIGGQGYIFGRGNQQVSPDVLRLVGRDNMLIVATTGKLASLYGAPLLLDTGDPELDAQLGGFARVVTGYRSEAVYAITS